MLAIKVILIIVCVFIIYQLLIRLFRKTVHFPAPAFIGRFLDSNLRRKMQPPYKLIQRSGVKEGMNVLEVGCGSGAFTTFVARAIGSKGKIYALDIQPGMLEQLRSKLSRPENEVINNVAPVKGSACNLPFYNSSLDLVYMVTVLQEIPNRNKALQEISRVLKPGGYLSVTELLLDPDYPWQSTTIKQGSQAGFITDGVAGNIWNYTVRFIKPHLHVKLAITSTVKKDFAV